MDRPSYFPSDTAKGLARNQFFFGDGAEELSECETEEEEDREAGGERGEEERSKERDAATGVSEHERRRTTAQRGDGWV